MNIPRRARTAIQRVPVRRGSRPFRFQFSVFSSRYFRRSRSSGQALVEYAIVFPIQLMITLAIIQLAHIFIARQVLEYAAFCAARARLVGLSQTEARQAALIPISRIAGPTGVTEGTLIEIPGWGPLIRSDAADAKTLDEEYQYPLDGQWVVQSELSHMYELQVPVGNVVAYALGDAFLGVENLDRETYGAPHLRMTARCLLAQPWEE